MKSGMLLLGLLLIFIGAGTSDADFSRSSFLTGVLIGFAGLLLMLFSFEGTRDPFVIKRTGRYILGHLL